MTPRSVVDAPYTGFMHALVRARIPYLPVHADDIERAGRPPDVLILPNVGALVGRAGGGHPAVRRARRIAARDRRRPVCTTNGAIRGRTSRSPICSVPPDRRDADAARRQRAAVPADPIGAFAPSPSGHTYLRLAPELRARVDGPRAGDEPAISGTRHRRAARIR